MVGWVHHAGDYRGLAGSLGAVLQSGTPGCHASGTEGRRLLERAQHAGVVRKDISLDDIVCVVTAVSISVEQGGSSESRVAHLVDVFLGGINVR